MIPLYHKKKIRDILIISNTGEQENFSGPVNIGAVWKSGEFLNTIWQFKYFHFIVKIKKQL